MAKKNKTTEEEQETKIKEKEPNYNGGETLPEEGNHDPFVNTSEDYTELKALMEDTAKVCVQNMQIGLMLNDQLTSVMNALNSVSANQMEIGKMFTKNPPDEIELFKVVIKPEHIEQLKVKTTPAKESDTE